jgi:hypothetical protein
MLGKTNVQEWSYEHLHDLHQQGKILHDITFNRIQAGAWDKSDKTSYIKTIYDERCYSLVVLVDVDSCLAYNIIINDVVSIEYFKKCKKDGYKYIILDGSNRIGCIEEYLKGLFNIIENKIIYDASRTLFKGKYLPISLITRSTKKQLHETAILLNSGKNWNSQERRNAMDAFIANFVRNISIGDYKINIGNKISGINVKRMQDQELIAQCVHLLHCGQFTNQSGLDALYYLPESTITNETYSKVKLHLDTMFTMFGSKKLMKFKKTFFLYTFALLNELHTNGYTINQDKVKNFFDDLADKWTVLDDDSITLYFSPERGQSYTWKNLMGFVGLEYNQKISVLLEFVYSNLSNSLEPVKDNKRSIDTSSNSKIRYELAKRDDCKVRVNGKVNGVWFNPEKAGEEYQQYRLHEVIKSSDINVDHILALKGPNKGEDSIDNMELTTFAYNNWKRAKI